ncbi:MAG: carboxypeptidase M32 [Victivallaceae bacterium]|nr:carboxypeptidase M32 [Victivallaceae bacterium]
MTDCFEKLLELLGGICDLRAAEALLDWDQQVCLPAAAAEGRARQLAAISGVIHERSTSAALGRLLDQLEASCFADDSFEAALVRRCRMNFEKSRRVPAKLVAATALTTGEAHGAWLKAREANDYAILAPHLAKIIELKREYAALFKVKHPYDALLDNYEPGMTTAELKRVFTPLCREQTKLIKAAALPAGEPEPDFMVADYSSSKQLRISEMVVRAMRYDFTRGRMDLTEHPFTTTLGPDDVRITTAVDRKLPVSCLLSTMHECGHALYEQGIDPICFHTPLADGASFGFHESQSRLWENQIGRSTAFWRWLYPYFKKAFPRQLSGVSQKRFLRTINSVRRTFVRTEADEATYNLHIMVRYELEVALFDGKIEAADLVTEWNRRMKKYLGIVPPDDRQGVLQDIHWPLGDFGYFPTYALGNLLAAQIFDAAKKAMPQLERSIARGEFAPLVDFLRENIHQYGARYTGTELLKHLTGSSRIDINPYLEYLRKNYLPNA